MKLETAKFRLCEQIERGLACSDNRDIKDVRKKAIRATPNRLKRLAMTTIFESTQLFPKTLAAITDNVVPEYLAYAGTGATATAYRHGSSIIKVIRRTEGLPRKALLEVARSEHLKNVTMSTYLGDLVVPQSLSIRPHPVRPSHEIVAIQQPYVSMSTLDEVFPAADDKVNRPALEAVLKSVPVLDAPLYSLAQNALTMAEDTSLVPDLTGRNNLGIVDAVHLRIIDGQPLSTTFQPSTDYIVPQLVSLKNFLDGHRAN